MSGAADRLERHSLLLFAATAAAHAGNTLYHAVAGRLLSDAEYGLLMSLFGAVNLLLLPMGALSLALTRAVAPLADNGGLLRARLRRWGLVLCAAVAGLLLVVPLFAPLLDRWLDLPRRAPLWLAALIPALNLGLVLSGAALQGLQRFGALAGRGALLFGVRAGLIGVCLGLGFRAAGWALLAHLLGMTAALVFSLLALRAALPPDGPRPARVPAGVRFESMAALPPLLAFAALLSLDAVLARHLYEADVAGRFAQAALLGRMILWLPLPIAQAMFPKVVRDGVATPGQTRILRKAMAYSLALALAAALGCALLAAPALRLLFGTEAATPEKILWLRGYGFAVAPLALTHLLIQYELARGRLGRLLPLCAVALLYPVLALGLRPEPAVLIGLLGALNLAALLVTLPVLREARCP